MTGIVVTTENEIRTQDFGEPLFKTVGAAVGGYIEVVHPQMLPRPYCMIVNEEGLIYDFPINAAGSVLYGTPEHGHPIVGNIVIMKIGNTPDGPDIIGLDERETEAFYNQLLNVFDLKGETE